MAIFVVPVDKSEIEDAMRSLGCPILEGGCRATISPIKGDKRDGSNQDIHLQFKDTFF